MSSKVKKAWATIISFTASRIFFFFIFFQIPLFRFPCRIGTCMTPLELTSSQLIASGVIPSGVVKVLLYPGAIGKAVFNNKLIPKYNNVLDVYKWKNIKGAPSTTDLQHLEVLAGSYLAVAGAIIGLSRSSRLGLFGMLLLLWGLFKESYFFKDNKNVVSIYYPTTQRPLQGPRGNAHSKVNGAEPWMWSRWLVNNRHVGWNIFLHMIKHITQNTPKHIHNYSLSFIPK